MIFLLMILICVAWFFIALWMTNKNDVDYEGGMIASAIVSVIVVFIGGMVQFGSNYFQHYSFEEYQKVSANVIILEERRDSLTTQFSGLLSEKFLNQESKLFSGMTPQDVDLLFVKYPELKSNLTLVELVQQIMRLNDDVYNQRLNLNDIELEIRMRYKNPWVFKWVLPSIPSTLGLKI